MSGVKSYKDLLIWQRGIVLSKDVYRLTNDFPMQEQYGITNQMRRCSVSIPSNIAEGFGRSIASNINYIKISRGSLYELDTQLILSRELGFIKDENLVSNLENEIAELGKMINTLINRLKEKL